MTQDTTKFYMNSLPKWCGVTIPRLSIVLPTHNEAYVLEKNVRTVHAFCAHELSAYDWEIVIADNGSTDATPEIAQQLTKELPRVRAFFMESSGRGGALKRAWEESSVDFVAYMDVDLATDLQALPLLIAALRNGADIAVGSRFVPGSFVLRSWNRELFSRGYNVLTHLFLGLHTRDAQCGFKAMTKKAAEILLPLTHNTQWFFDTECLYYAEKRKMVIAEVPVSWVEARDRKRKSTVRVFRTIVAYCFLLARLRWRASVIYRTIVGKGHHT